MIFPLIQKPIIRTFDQTKYTFMPIQSPLDLERSHGFNYMGCIWCIQSKPLMVTVHMQARGFTPGEKIEVILDVNNQSSQDVAYFSIGLFKVSNVELVWIYGGTGGGHFCGVSGLCLVSKHFYGKLHRTF